VGLQIRKNVFLGEWELPDNCPVLGRLPRIELLVLERSDAEAGLGVERT
jgi:hypothetical protein